MERTAGYRKVSSVEGVDRPTMIERVRLTVAMTSGCSRSPLQPTPKNTSFLTERMQAELDLDPVPLREGLERMRTLSPSPTFSSRT